MVWSVSARYGATGTTSVYVKADTENVARRKVEEALRANGLRRVCINNCVLTDVRK